MLARRAPREAGRVAVAHQRNALHQPKGRPRPASTALVATAGVRGIGSARRLLDRDRVFPSVLDVLDELFKVVVHLVVAVGGSRRLQLAVAKLGAEHVELVVHASLAGLALARSFLSVDGLHGSRRR